MNWKDLLLVKCTYCKQLIVFSKMYESNILDDDFEKFFGVRPKPIGIYWHSYCIDQDIFIKNDYWRPSR